MSRDNMMAPYSCLNDGPIHANIKLAGVKRMPTPANNLVINSHASRACGVEKQIPVLRQNNKAVFYGFIIF